MKNNFDEYIDKAKTFKKISVDIDGDSLYIHAEHQEWNDPIVQRELKQLDIFFTSCGVTPIRLVERGSHNPMIFIGTEDDGTIFFNECSLGMDIFWARHLISDLESAIKSADERKLITFQRDFTVNINTGSEVEV